MVYPYRPSNIGNITSNTINTNFATHSIIDDLKEQETFNRISISATTLASNHINIYDVVSNFEREVKDI